MACPKPFSTIPIMLLNSVMTTTVRRSSKMTRNIVIVRREGRALPAPSAPPADRPLHSTGRSRLFFAVGGFASRINAGLRVAGGDERGCDVDSQSGIDHSVLGLFERLLGTRHVDLMAFFGYVGEHAHDVIVNFEKAAADRDAVAMIPGRGVGESPDSELRYQRRMVRKDADVAVLGGNLGAHRFFARQEALRGCNLDVEGVGH